MIDKMREREIKRNYERFVIDKMRETRREREGERERDLCGKSFSSDKAFSSLSSNGVACQLTL